jgi:biotin transport system substrate-specific component
MNASRHALAGSGSASGAGTFGTATLLGSIAAHTGVGRADTGVALKVAAVLFVTTLTALAAQLSVPLPFTVVPFTLQPMIVLLGGAALGARLGLSSQVLYLSLGLVGLPVFAASPVLPQGAARLIGPTGGFLLAYPLAAFVTGWLAERRFDREYLTSLGAMAAGLAIVFASGVSWMAWGFAPVGIGAALERAFFPFLLADLVKLALAATVLPAVWRIVGRSRE